jgi:NADH-quinone oxidoreductase subunit L
MFLNQIHLYENYTIIILNTQCSYIELISLLFLICAFIKSAQFGAHIWLPDSMEAPVPASALIHSATLVSAGIYLLLRFTPLFELSKYSLSIIAFIGSITAFYGGITSAFQSDAKRVLAYSTISHCGFLMVIYSTGVIEYTILYLYVHGFFKAATFLCVGNIIRFSRNTQDFKRMGGYVKFLPADAILTFVCIINLSGLPLTFGFFIKHFLFVGLRLNLVLYYLVLINCLFGALTGLFYGYRLYYSIFFDFKKARKSIYTTANKKTLKSKYYTNTTKASTIAIIILVIVSYCVSVFLIDLFLSKNFLYSDFNNYYFSILLFDLY